MTTLPDRRVIHDGWQDVNLSEDEVSAIEDAICAGKQIRCDVKDAKREWGKPKPKTEPGEIKPEACLTRFIDPFAGVTRWAVESWDSTGSSRGVFKADYSTEAAALAKYHSECDRLNI